MESLKMEGYDGHPEEYGVSKSNYKLVKGLITGEDLLRSEIRDVPKLWEPFFNQVGIAGLVGSSDCGKSTFLRQLSIAITSGKDNFLGFQLHCKHRRVLYVCTEDNIESVTPSFYKQVGGMDRSQLKGIMFFFPEAGDIYQQIEDILSETPVDLVVLDAWADIYKGGANQFTEIRDGMQPLKKIANEHKCCIVIIHHTTKNSEDSKPNKSRINGSQAIEAVLRSVIELRNMDDIMTKGLTVLKGNFISSKVKGSMLKLRFDEEHLTFTTENEFIDLDDSALEKTKRKYNDERIFEELLKLKENGISFENCRKELVLKFEEDKVPSVTQLKAIHKRLVGQK